MDVVPPQSIDIERIRGYIFGSAAPFPSSGAGRRVPLVVTRAVYSLTGPAGIVTRGHHRKVFDHTSTWFSAESVSPKFVQVLTG